MSAVFNRAWIGGAYCDSSRKVLLVAESQVRGLKGNPLDFTVSVVDEWSEGQPSNTITRFARLVTGQSNAQMDRRTALRRFAYYNFIQIMMETIHHKPSEEQAVASLPAFRETLGYLSPHRIVICSYVAWEAISPKGDHKHKRVIAGQNVDLAVLMMPWGKVPVLGLQHASRISPARFAPVVSTFLGMTLDDLDR